MRRIVVVLLALVVVALISAQLFLPGAAEHNVENRLERHGGTAHVSLSAIPALRLLFGEGDSLTVKGSGLRLTPERQGRTLDRLDGFNKVSVTLSRLVSGPLDVSSFTLKRGDGERNYRAGLSATTTAAKVGSYLGSAAGGPLGGILGGLTGGSLGGGAPIPLTLDAVLASRNGRAQVVSATGSVAGVPAGLVAALVANAVAAQL
ncbi:MAG: hypothetical protein ACJ766_19005 [Thermoleophilaceae bacterium]|jgi:hypothetical protein